MMASYLSPPNGASKDNIETIYQKVRAVGGRLTKARRALIDVLYNQNCLLKKNDLQKKMRAKKIIPDRSTLHRELIFLLAHNIIHKNTIRGIDYFEMSHHHHHHLICLTCQQIDHIAIDNHKTCRLETEEKIIMKKNHFAITNHSLNYYGYCQKCQ
ncbi:MAG: Fur family transcriptional regulator [Alphaproteobacteria bacterium]